jgi:hypothetical protein
MLKFARVKFNLAYFGPEHLFHLRRDFLLATRYGLESLGHDVMISGLQLDTHSFNLIAGAYFLSAAELQRLPQAGVPMAHINTEVIANDQLNFRADKTDFLGGYLPAMRSGAFVWDVIMDNLAEHRRYGTNAHFMRWGWDPRLEEIAQREPKDLDFYFFGMLSARRNAILEELARHGLVGAAHQSCPYFVRNDRISRARVNLNIVQEDRYTHVNSFRICYLANNRCAILSEAESDPAGYLDVARVVHRKEEFVDAMRELLAGDAWKALGDAGYEKFRAMPMRQCMEELLDASFGSNRGAAAGAAG